MKRIYAVRWLLFICILTGVFFYKTVISGSLPIPADTLVGLYHPWRDIYATEYPRGVPFKNFLITDPIRQQIPWRKLVIETWKSGRLPGWNPYTFAGVPLNANIQAAPFYPLNILFFIFSFPIAWTALIMIQPLLAGLFLYGYLRFQKLGQIASVIGAITWAFCGFSVSWMTWGTITQTALWGPLMLLAIDRLIAAHTHSGEDGRFWTIILTSAMVMTVTAGHTQIAIYMIGLAGLYAAWRLQTHKYSGVKFMWIACAAAFVITAVQWIPFVWYLPETGRITSQDAWKVAGWFLPWQHLAQFVAPDFFGNPATLNYWGVWNYGEFIGYTGVISLVLAISSVFVAGAPLFFSAALLLSLLCMLPTPVAMIPFMLHIPFVSVLQPTRLMVVVDLSLAVLAAYGFDAMRKHGKRMQIAFGVVGLSFVALWIVILVSTRLSSDAAFLSNVLISRRNLMVSTVFYGISLLIYVLFARKKTVILTRLGGVLLLSVLIIDLFRFGWKFTPFVSQKYLFPESKILMYIQQQHAPFRVMSLDDRIMPPNTSSYYGIETIEGYDPIAPLRYEKFLAASELGVSDTRRASGFNRIYTAHNINSVLLPYLNVRYVLSLSDLEGANTRKVMQDGELRLYEYTKLLPRAYIAEQIFVETKPEKILNMLIGSSPSLVGIVEKSIDILSFPLEDTEGVQITTYLPNKIVMHVRTVNPRLVVLLNSYNSRWTARIGKKFIRVVPVNYLFTGVVVPAGTNDITFIYQ